MSYSFPVQGLLPKQETQAELFQRNTAHDGTGTVIAILDTGVDPAAAGLSKTPAGLPKVIDIIDCTGAGDVVLKTAEPYKKIVDGEECTAIKGLSGKELLLPNVMNPSNAFKVGIKNTKELFPKVLQTRICKERKAEFMKKHHALFTETMREYSEVDRGIVVVDGEKNEHLNELKIRSDILNSFGQEYEDAGENIDCIVFNDGTNWRSLIDVTGSGDLRKQSPMTDYKKEFQYGCFGVDSLMTYSINIYDDGETLSIVTTAGAHGTHVAAITAAYHPEDTEINGVAPGAQIVSLKIGDERLGSMETGQGLIRAGIELAKLKVDLANMSYGEGTSIPNEGRFVEILKDEVINKAGCIFVASAGNNGPALTTVGAPGGTMDHVIGVGAYVSHSMMAAEYAMLENVPQRPYTWSSRGPSADGDIGVDIFAPGAAITSVPQFTIQKSQLMNGTSMSSPNCCGCIALLLSGLKREGVPYTPYLIKAAIKNTAASIKDPMNIGLIQVNDAWKYLTTVSKGNLPISLHYEIKVGNGRGVYLRDLHETNTLVELPLSITPVFPNQDDPKQNVAKVEYEVRIALKSSHSWIKAPEFSLISNAGRTMNIRVDSTHLYPGKLNLTFGFHFGTISGFDVTNPQLGPLFSIPITVCKPDSVPSKEETSFIQYNNLSFKPGDIIRNFVSVPSTANFAEIKISTKGRLTPARFLVHLLQLHPQSRYTVFEHEYAFGLVSSGIENITSYKKSFPVLPGVTLEVCLAQFWSSLDQCNVSVELSFHSVLVSASSGTQSVNGATGMSGGSNLLINSGNYGFTRFDVATPLRRESLTPKVSFNKVEKSFRPTDNSVGPLKSRDILPNGTCIHELVNTYSVMIDDAASVYFKVPRFKQMLYDSSLDNFAIYVFDKNNKPIVFQDIYGEEQKFKEGDYTVLVQFASADLQLLKSLESTCLIAEYKLEAPIELPLANKIGELGKAGSKVGTIVSGKGERKVFWAGEIAKIPKVAKAGDLLTGSFEFVGNDEKIDGILYTVAYLVPPEFKPKEIDLSIKEPEKEDSAKFSEAVRDLEISWVAKMKSIESKLDLAKTLAIRYPDSLELDQQTLLIINEEDCANSIRIAERISLVESILAKVDQTEVAVYYGQKIEAIHQKEKNLQKVMGLKKDVIALSFKAFAKLYASLELPDGPEKVANDKLFDDYLLKYTQWTAAELTDDGQYLILFAIQQRRKKFYGIALDKIVKYLSNPKNISKQEYANLVTIKTELIELLGWDLWKKHNDNWKVVDFPVERAHF